MTTVLAVGPEETFGVGAVVPGPDGVRGTMPLRPVLSGPDGQPSVGSLGVLVDDVTGYAVNTRLADGTWSVTTEIWLDLLAPVPATGDLSAHAQVVRGSKVSVFTSGTVHDRSGHCIAVCRQRGRALPEAPAQVRPSDYRVPSAATDAAGLIGLRSLGPDRTGFTVTAHLENPLRILHGGITFCASEIAATSSRSAAGVDLPTSSVHVVYARAIPAGADVDLTVTTRHAGRSFWVSEVTGRVEGRVCSVATVTAQHL
jgi:acyl-coenzyme A thioesterase PaaI-like protein